MNTAPVQSNSVRRRPSFWNVVLGLLVVATFIRAWAPQEPVLPKAEAQVKVVNPSAQRQQQVIEARRTTQILTDIKRLLESGKLHVVVDVADNLPGSGKLPRKRGR